MKATVCRIDDDKVELIFQDGKLDVRVEMTFAALRDFAATVELYAELDESDEV